MTLSSGKVTVDFGAGTFWSPAEDPMRFYREFQEVAASPSSVPPADRTWSGKYDLIPIKDESYDDMALRFYTSYAVPKDRVYMIHFDLDGRVMNYVTGNITITAPKPLTKRQQRRVDIKVALHSRRWIRRNARHRNAAVRDLHKAIRYAKRRTA